MSATFSIRSVLFLLFVTGFGFSSTADGAVFAGQTIGIDFGLTAPDATTNFNDFGNSTIANGASSSLNIIKDVNNASVSGVTFTLQNNSGRDSNPTTSNGGDEGPASMNHASIYGDRFISNDANNRRLTDGDDVIDGTNDRGHFVLTFSGLDDSLTYNLTGGADSNNSNFNAIWQAGGAKSTDRWCRY